MQPASNKCIIPFPKGRMHALQNSPQDYAIMTGGKEGREREEIEQALYFSGILALQKVTKKD